MSKHRSPYPGPDLAWLEESRRKHESGLVPLIAEFLLGAACRRAPGSRGFCGRYLSIVAERLEMKVLTRFSSQELYALAALLRLTEDRCILEAFAPEERRALLERLRAITPVVRRTTGRRTDGDADAAARSALHPESAAIGEASVDIPEDADA